MTPQICPCRVREKTPIAYQNCCAILHQSLNYLENNSNALAAAGIEQIMRSRYTAFVLELLDYLLKTTYFEDDALSKQSSNQLNQLNQLTIDLEAQFNNKTKTHWQGLNVIDVDHISKQVEFKAYYKLNGRAICLHERSQFVKTNTGYFCYAPEHSKLFSD